MIIYLKEYLHLKEINIISLNLEGKNEEIKGEIQGEKKKSIEIAKEILKEKMPIDKIMKFTGLTEEEIEKIK